MILDNLLIFDGSQNASGVLSGVALTATATSSNIIDLVNARDIGGSDEGLQPRLLVLVMTTLVSAGATTLQINFDGSTDSSTWTTYAASPVIAKATLVQGAELMNFTVPGVLPQTGANPRYLRLNYTVATGPFTGGTVLSAIVLQREDPAYYPPGVTVNN